MDVIISFITHLFAAVGVGAVIWIFLVQHKINRIVGKLNESSQLIKIPPGMSVFFPAATYLLLNKAGDFIIDYYRECEAMPHSTVLKVDALKHPDIPEFVAEAIGDFGCRVTFQNIYFPKAWMYIKFHAEDPETIRNLRLNYDLFKAARP